MDAASRPRVRLLLPGLVLVVLATALGGWLLARGEPFAVDAEWNTMLARTRMPGLETAALVFDRLGGLWISGLAVSLLGSAALLLARRPRAAAYLLSAQLAAALAVQVLKHLFGRARPEDILVLSDYGSFPSGHTANAATIVVVAVVLLPRWWVTIVGAAWVVLMALSRTYVHAHWLSDTIGGALIGAGVALVVAAAFGPRLSQR